MTAWQNPKTTFSVPAQKIIFTALASVLVLLSHASLPAKAQEGASAPALPAVDGVNGKISGFGGAFDGQPLYGGTGSFTAPLGTQFGLQLDALAGGLNSRLAGEASIGATTGHLFWRNPSVGLLGLYGQYVHANAFDGVDSYGGAFEGALYRGRMSLDAIAGAETGSAKLGGINLDLGTRFFDVADLSYYPLDDVKLSIGHIYTGGTHAAQFGAEWGFATGGGTMAALFAKADVTERGETGVLAGLRLYFGERDKPLIRRHQEDDPIALQYIGRAIFLIAGIHKFKQHKDNPTQIPLPTPIALLTHK